MAQAGFNPQNATDIFKDFEPTLKAKPPFMSRPPTPLQAHPSIETRKKYSKKNADKVMPLYESSKKNVLLVAKNPIINK